jgi:hypothetical protein
MRPPAFCGEPAAQPSRGAAGDRDDSAEFFCSISGRSDVATSSMQPARSTGCTRRLILPASIRETSSRSLTSSTRRSELFLTIPRNSFCSSVTSPASPSMSRST